MDEIRTLIRRYLILGWRNRWFAIGVTWLVCLAGWGVVAWLPDHYEASARLYVDSDAVLTPLLKGLALNDTPEGRLDVLQRTLLSRPNLENLISKTGLDLTISSPGDRENLVKRLASEIKVTLQTKTLFTISYQDNNSKLAYDVVQAILTIFIESRSGTSRADMRNAEQFLQGQIAGYERQLRQAEARRAEFRSKYIDLLPSDGGLSRLDVARVQVVTLTGTLIDLNRKRELIEHEMATTSPTLSEDEGPGRIRRGSNPALISAEIALSDLRLRYTEQHPEVIASRQRVEQLRASGLGAVPAAAAEPRARGRPSSNPVFEHLKMQLLDTEASISSMERQVADATKESSRLEAIARGAPGVQAEYANLNRDYDVLYKDYVELLGRRESMRLSSAAQTETEMVKLQVVDPPQIPRIPIGPKRILMVTAVLGLGLAAGSGLVLLLRQLDRSFQSVEDLQVFGVPVAGGISLISKRPPLHLRIFGVASFGSALLLLGMAYCALLVSLIGGVT